MNWGNIFKIESLLSNLYGQAKVLVKGIEADVPGLAGSQKFQAVMAGLAAAAGTIESDAAIVASVLPTVGAFVHGLVAAYNMSGLFSHASAGVNRIGDAVDKAAGVLGA